MYLYASFGVDVLVRATACVSGEWHKDAHVAS